ncbi:MAG TPA: PEGA domain-containing protein [Vicinamibacterales bacterium]|jgi:hypothetical protein
MAVSVPESMTDVPGFPDPLGERLVAAQPSGALLEYLVFRRELAGAPFFEAALKDRVMRLANFRHAAYARIRGTQHLPERDDRIALISAHVPGPRLSEILSVAGRTGLCPRAGGALYLTRQLMAGLALLHDFAPDVFHGALGPERVVLTGAGRIVIAEHVLGSVVAQGIPSWGVRHLWREFRLAAVTDTESRELGRRMDLVQLGLIVLAVLLGRPIGVDEYPEGVFGLLDDVTETDATGVTSALGQGLRGWLGRMLSAKDKNAFNTLVEAQKALAQLWSEGQRDSPSSTDWEAFVLDCESAAAAPPPGPPSAARPVEAREKPPVDAAPPVPPAAPASALAMLRPDQWEQAVVGRTPEPGPTAAGGGTAEPAAPPDVDAGSPTLPMVAPAGESPADLVTDPFGPWPVAVPSQSAATLLEAFNPEGAGAPKDSMSALVAAPESTPATPASNAWQRAEAAPPPAKAEEPAPRPAEPVPLLTSPSPIWTSILPATVEIITDSDGWGGRPDHAHRLERDAAPFVGTEAEGEVLAVGDDVHATKAERIAETFSDEPAPVARPESPEPRRRMQWRPTGAGALKRIRQLLVLAVLVLIGSLALVYAPRFWNGEGFGGASFGTVKVGSDPAGAEIAVDGEPRGRTPTTLVLRAGPHQLEWRSGGSVSSKRITVVSDRQITATMSLPRGNQRGGLRLTTYPIPGKISLDGNLVGQTPLRVTDLEPGDHAMFVETSLGTQEVHVVVEPGKISTLAVPTVSWIKVAAPFELKVYEEARLLGTTGNAPVMVSPGRHTFSFVNQALALKLPQFVDVAPGQFVIVPLELPLGMMNLYADQTAEVTLDGKVIGQTPMASLPTPLGPHEVVFRHPRYGEVRYTVMVTLAAPVGLTVTFRK